MLCDYAVHQKVKLYVLFIDFSKAYDQVPRMNLIVRFKSLGCGVNMIKAIRNMYVSTKNVLKSPIINASIGVRQGAPSNCLLFVLYVDYIIRMLRMVGDDGFWGGLH